MGPDADAWQGDLAELLRKLEYNPTTSGACVAKEHILRAGDRVRISGEASVEADPRQAGTYRHVSSAKFFRGRGAPVSEAPCRARPALGPARGREPHWSPVRVA
jgi:hypothetical protein